MDPFDKVIHSIREFPTLPTVYTKLSDIIANPRSTANDVASLISQDQAAASKILRAANSSIYGFRGRINTISQAVIYIGFDEVKNLIIAMSIINLFKKFKHTQDFNPIDLWRHSIGVGVITRYLGRSIGIKNIENYFVAGILHDIGKLVFLKSIPEQYLKVINYALENNISAKDAESEILGITHTIVGDLLAERWKLPISIKDSIRYHNTGRVEGKLSLIVSCVHIANVAASIAGFGQAGDDVIPEPNPEVWDALNLPENFFTKSMKDILNDYEESVQLLL